jgi:dihydroorotase
MVARDVLLAGHTGGHVHLCHMSTRGSVALIRHAKDRHVPVTAEVCPHHYALTHEACGDYDTNAKMNPPLRELEDVEAIREGLRDGTIDLIATDHAPHHYDAKEREFDDAPFGIVGLETALGLGLTVLVAGGVLTLGALIARMSTIPARTFGLPGGTLATGRPADLIIIDPEVRWRVDPQRFRSKSRNTPFAGWELQGAVVRTVVGGRTVFLR